MESKKTYILNLPAASAVAGPPLGPMLGQFGLNTVKFVADFNEKTAVFSEITPKLKSYLTINQDKTYVLKIDKPSISSIFVAVSIPSIYYELNGIRYITFSDFIKILLFKFKIQNSDEFKKLVFKAAGTLKSMKIRFKKK